MCPAGEEPSNYLSGACAPRPTSPPRNATVQNVPTNVNIDFSVYAGAASICSVPPYLTMLLNGGPSGKRSGLQFFFISPFRLGSGSCPSGSASGITNGVNNGNYPTSQQIVFTFSQPVSNIVFTYYNAGCEDSGRGNSFIFTYDPLSTLVDSVNVGCCACGFDSGGTLTLSSTNIASLVLDNGSGGTDNWWLEVRRIAFTVDMQGTE